MSNAFLLHDKINRELVFEANLWIGVFPGQQSAARRRECKQAHSSIKLTMIK